LAHDGEVELAVRKGQLRQRGRHIPPRGLARLVVGEEPVQGLEATGEQVIGVSKIPPDQLALFGAYLCQRSVQAVSHTAFDRGQRILLNRIARDDAAAFGCRFRIEARRPVGAAEDSAFEVFGRQIEEEAVFVKRPAPGDDPIEFQRHGCGLLHAFLGKLSLPASHPFLGRQRLDTARGFATSPPPHPSAIEPMAASAASPGFRRFGANIFPGSGVCCVCDATIDLGSEAEIRREWLRRELDACRAAGLPAGSRPRQAVRC
jgi:hypothetical protein